MNALPAPLKHVRGDGWNAHTSLKEAHAILDWLDTDIRPQSELLSDPDHSDRISLIVVFT